MTTPIEHDGKALAEGAASTRQNALKLIVLNPIGSACLIVIGIIVLVSALAPLLAPYDPAYVKIAESNAPPFSEGHLLGTDATGRDVLSRLLWAGQLTLIGAAVTVIVSILLGVTTGLIAGYFGGLFDIVASWCADILLVLPSKIILVALFAIIGPNTVMTMAVLGVMVSPGFFRLVRNLVISVRDELYVDAARVSGLSNTAIISRHILYIVRAPIIIQASFVAGIAVVIQAGLEFIGLGDPSTPTWGGMLQDAFMNMHKAPWLILWPGLLIGLFVGAFILLGNTVRDSLEEGVKSQRAKPAPRTGFISVVTEFERSGGSEAPSHQSPGPNSLLTVQDLSLGYPQPDGGLKAVIKNVSLSVARGEVLGLVGESGSGKTQTAFAVLGLLPDTAEVTSGSINFDGIELRGLSERKLRTLRGKRIAYVPQEPMSNLDPAFRVGFHLVEPMRTHLSLNRADAKSQALELLNRVGIKDPKRTFEAYPHEISGGMAQRVLIAGAISCDPDFIIADEPTTALDVTVQSEILDLLHDLQEERDLGMLLVTHNFGVVADLCDRVAVMQTGSIIEEKHVNELFVRPDHPYTQMLLSASLDNAPTRPTWKEKLA